MMSFMSSAKTFGSTPDRSALGNIDDLMDNPDSLNGGSLVEVQKALKNSSG